MKYKKFTSNKSKIFIPYSIPKTHSIPFHDSIPFHSIFYMMPGRAAAMFDLKAGVFLSFAFNIIFYPLG